MKKSIYLAILSVLILSCSSNHTLPPIAVPLNRASATDTTNSFNTYTIYFSARHIDLSNSEIEKNKFLSRSFRNFAKGIGENNAVVWTGSNNKKFDIDISKDLCDKYGLSYTGGPYIVFSETNPIINKKQHTKDIILDFTWINPDRIKFVLDSLEKTVRTGKFKENISTEKYIQIVLSAYDNQKDFIQDTANAILSRKKKQHSKTK